MAIKLAPSRSSSVRDLEEQLRFFHAERNASLENTHCELSLPGGATGILAETWLGMLSGTIAALAPTTVIAAGHGTPLSPTHPFISTPGCLSALRTARRITGAKGDVVSAVSFSDIVEQLILPRKGVLDQSGAERTLVEVDPDLPVAEILLSEGVSKSAPAESRRLFTHLVLAFRAQLEIGALRRRVEPVSEGPGGAVGRFLYELHQNGLEHGARIGGGPPITGTRLLRLRKHVGRNAEDLIRRHAGAPGLERYLTETLAGSSTAAIVEATISDFGLGIVDGFLATPAGQRYQGHPRRALLELLVNEQLSSKESTSSGLGTIHSLMAARQMQAYVSLRTSEFWLNASFLPDNAETRLTDAEASAEWGEVRGTHWAFLWPQP